MSIEEYMSKREEIENINIDKIKKTNKKLKELMEIPAVIEYITEEKKMKKLENKRDKSISQFEQDYQEQCNHDMYALIGSYKDNIYSEDIYCIICGKKINIPKDQLELVKNELFHQKLLIAYYKGLSEETKLPVLSPLSDNNKNIKDNIELFRLNYYKQYLSIKKRKKLNRIPNAYSEEEAIFNYFCIDGYLQLIIDEKKNQHIK